jgi:hypothetical protein
MDEGSNRGIKVGTEDGLLGVDAGEAEVEREVAGVDSDRRREDGAALAFDEAGPMEAASTEGWRVEPAVEGPAICAVEGVGENEDATLLSRRSAAAAAASRGDTPRSGPSARVPGVAGATVDGVADADSVSVVVRVGAHSEVDTGVGVAVPVDDPSLSIAVNVCV